MSSTPEVRRASVADLPADPRISIPIAPTSTAYRVAKRTLDLTLASLGLLAATPVFIAIGAAIRLESPGPIMFRQERIGLGGRHFTVFKFRTMHVTADEEEHRRHVSRLLRPSAAAPTAHETTWVPISADARVTRLGGFLRDSHLDELPQLLNILHGEMSLVGPRPPIPYEVELYEPWHLRRLSVLPGLTGLWQAMAWGQLSFAEGVVLDLEYVDRRSFWLDMRILARTAWQILTGRQF